MSNTVIFYVQNGSGTGQTGLSLSFTSFINQTGAPISQPAIVEIGGGFYNFNLTFSSVNLGILYIINTSYSPAVIFDYVRHEDFNITGLVSSPQEIFFPLFNSNYTPATGQSLTFLTYTNQAGVGITNPTITEIGNGWYGFLPVFSAINTEINYVIYTPTLIPETTYQFVLLSDFTISIGPSPPIINTSAPSITLSGPVIVDLGTDLNDLNDIGLIDTFVSGFTNVAQRVLRRLSTQAGALSLIDPDPNAAQSIDLTEMINSKMTQTEQASAANLITNLIELDQEVSSAQTQINFGETTNINIQISTAAGPFTLTINVDDLTAQILYEETGNA